MEAEGENPILDFAKRSDAEQKRLFDAGLSKCDGVIKESRHQRGMAVDIYFDTDMEHPGLEEPAKGWLYWHERWERMGGSPMIVWDRGHFEG